jgi:anti-anti-sigma factor
MAILHEPRVFLGRLEGTQVLVLKGVVRYVSAQSLRKLIDDMLAHEIDDTVIIDLRELESIDSTGLGLLAHVGRTTLRRGRRAVIVSTSPDILRCLRSVAFDTMFVVLDAWPGDTEPTLQELTLENEDASASFMGRSMLIAHRNLAELSAENRRSFADVIAALEAELQEDRHSSMH